MYIPNVEAVTLLITVYTYCFGIAIGFPAAMVFCVMEGLIFGFNPTWLVSYFIHWGFVSVAAYLIKILKIKKPILVALIMGAVTALFGVQSTFIYYLLGGAVGKAGWEKAFLATYVAGWVFYVTQVICNLVAITVFFKPLTNKLFVLGDRYFGVRTY